MIIETIAGTVGTGDALAVAQAPAALALRGHVLYAADGLWCVVRSLDLRTLDQQVVAGNGGAGFSGDDGPATAAQLSSPNAVDVDDDGNVFIVDYDNQRIRRVDQRGEITTVAGTGAIGYNGDNQPATSAQLNTPNGVAVDARGAIYIADTNNQRIRKVSPTGMISTIAGTGKRGFSGDGGPAVEADLHAPSGVRVDRDGNVFIADTNNNRIRRVSRSGLIATVAGTGVAGYSGDGGPATEAQISSPLGIAIAADGSVIVPDFESHSIRKVDPQGTISTIAGTGKAGYSGDGGPAGLAQLDSPTDAAVDGAASVYIADFLNSRVRRIDRVGTITTQAGNGWEAFAGDGNHAHQAQLSYPAGVCRGADGGFYIADTSNNRVRRVDRGGVISTVAGDGTPAFGGDGCAATAAQLNNPAGVAFTAAGELLVADTGNNRVRRVDRGGVISTVAGDGTPAFGGDGCAATAAQLNNPAGVAITAAGELLVADTGNNRVRRVDRGGVISTVAGDGTPAFGGDGCAATAAQLNNPAGVAITAAGELLVADTGNNRVRRVDRGGVISTIAGDGTPAFGGDGGAASAAQLRSPTATATDSAGNVYIVDSGNQRLRVVNAQLVIVTLAGDGQSGFIGDGRAPARARVNLSTDPAIPSGVFHDGSGALYIADTGNHRIRRIAPLPSVAGSSAAAGR